MADNPWTEERVALLKQLAAKGLSASQIASQLGEVTRNGVIGKILRAKIDWAAARGRLGRPRFARAELRVVAARSAPPPMAVDPLPPSPIPTGPGLPIEKLGRYGLKCRWPLWNEQQRLLHGACCPGVPRATLAP
jgi:GcrA cell cycle regulator